jgi:hypothetical protein
VVILLLSPWVLEAEAGSCEVESENNENKPPRKDLPTGKGKHSFEAIDPVNVLLPIDALVSTITSSLVCPCVCCSSKVFDEEGVLTIEKTLEVEMQHYGFATEVFIWCTKCDYSTAIIPTKTQTKDDTPNSTPTKKRSTHDAEYFHQYAVNYCGGFMMQKLGIGCRGLDLVMAFLGIAANHGSDYKWNLLMDWIGVAEEQIASKVMDENLQLEKKLTVEAVNQELLEWLESDDGMDAEPEDTELKRNNLLLLEAGKSE